MKSGRIFLLGRDQRTLTPMEEKPYANEDILQVLLAQYPELIPGDQIDAEEPRRWILVSREQGVPKEERGSGNWSLDHLFLDQDGIPTFVECKRASDTRTRREVVAQMLDYAANGTEYWGMDRLRQAATETAQGQGKLLDEEIQELIGSEDVDVEAYWKTVEENLRSGRVRLLFVTDQTPVELRRLVEFLNSKMADVEVLAVEIKQFVGSGEQKAVVPRVIGQTEAARQHKKSAERKERPILTEGEFWDKLQEKAPDQVQKVRELCEFYQSSRIAEILPGTNGLKFLRPIQKGGKRVLLFFITTDANVQVQLQAPRQQFESAGLDRAIVEDFGMKVRNVLNGFKAPLHKVDIRVLKNTVQDFIDQIDRLRSGVR